MKGFCQHCGKELNGDEPVCPECGMPTGVQVPQYSAPIPAAPSRANIRITTIIIAIIAICCILAVAFMPQLVNKAESKYEVTVYFDKFSIDLEDTEQYSTSPTVDVALQFYYEDSKGSHFNNIMLYMDYDITSGAEVVPLTKSISFNTTGNPEDVKYTAYMMISVKYSMGTIDDIVDLYSVDTSEITGSSKYYGCTGVSFTIDDLSGDSITLEGDSDPIGHLTMRIEAVRY